MSSKINWLHFCVTQSYEKIRFSRGQITSFCCKYIWTPIHTILYENDKRNKIAYELRNLVIVPDRFFNNCNASLLLIAGIFLNKDPKSDE